MMCLVHALAAEPGLWAEQVPALLAAGCSVLRVDLGGRGGSAATPGPFRMADLAGDDAAMLPALALPPVHLVGMSPGGMVGPALALAHPGPFRSVVTCDALPNSLPDADENWGPRSGAAGAAGSVAPLAEGRSERWRTLAFRAARPERWEENRAAVSATDAEGSAASAEPISAVSHVVRLPGPGVPLLVPSDEDDHAMSPAEGERIARLVPDGRFQAIPGMRHLPSLERQDLFNQLLEWVARIG
jgi:3-oxoadipate enol-lactonase